MSFQDSADALFKGLNKVFGTTATYTYASDSSTQELDGVFENGFIEVNGVITKTPLFKNVILDDLTDEPTDTDTLTINSVIYIVRSHEPDSHGSTTLILEKQ
jgi:hypothetical protein